jgi:hypothetical protein
MIQTVRQATVGEREQIGKEWEAGRGKGGGCGVGSTDYK